MMSHSEALSLIERLNNRQDSILEKVSETIRTMRAAGKSTDQIRKVLDEANVWRKF